MAAQELFRLVLCAEGRTKQTHTQKKAYEPTSMTHKALLRFKTGAKRLMIRSKSTEGVFMNKKAHSNALEEL